MRNHPEACPCVVCDPVRCTDCGSANPYLTGGVCRHRRACEARQMLKAGASSADAARHAQNLPLDDFEGGASKQAGPESNEPSGSGRGVETPSRMPRAASPLDESQRPTP